MKDAYLQTSDLARAVGVHPNTIRLYETWGFLPPIPRGPNGYRLFTEEHVDQLQLARLALSELAVGRDMKNSLRDLVWLAASGGLEMALTRGYDHQGEVQEELARATAALDFLRQWKQGEAPGENVPLHTIGQAAQRIGTKPYIVRWWEDYGFFQVPRHPHNGYRLYGPAQMGRLYVVRMLRQAGYTIEVGVRIIRQLDQCQESFRSQNRETGPLQDHHEDLLDIAQRWHATLLVHQIRIQNIITLLKEMIRKRSRIEH